MKMETQPLFPHLSGSVPEAHVVMMMATTMAEMMMMVAAHALSPSFVVVVL